MLTVAEEVFAELGYQAASMDEISNRVGVSKPMLYEYFGSKEGLFGACAARARTQLLEVTRGAVAQATSARDAMWRGHLAFFEFVDAHAQAWSVMLDESLIGREPGGGAIEAIRRQQTGFIAEVLGSFKPGVDAQTVQACAQMLVGAAERLAVWRAAHREVSPEQATRYLMDLCWPGLDGLTGTRP